jgi:hypothetical protein
MKKWIPILAVLLVVLCASGCTSQTQTNSSNSTTVSSSGTTFSGNGTTFQIPQGWNQYTPDEGMADRIAALETDKGNYSLLSVYIKPDEGQGLEYWKTDQKNSLESSETKISEGPVQIAGVNGYRLDYSYTDNGGGQHTDIIFVKNGKYYDLMFTTSSINDINSDINTIISSFQTT